MTLKQLLKVSKGSIINEYKEVKIKKLSTDTRTMNSKDFFVALTGKNYNGHGFIKEAISKKASAIIIEEDIDISTNIPIIKVNNTYDFLIDYATYLREKYKKIPLIAITGSVGKTTTKDLISHILSDKYKVLFSSKSQNNHIGIPITLSKLNNTHDLIVLELGMNHLKEISKLSKIVKPDLAIITNIGTSHIGILKNKKNILKAKLEILDGMNNKKLLINNNDKYLKKLKNTIKHDEELYINNLEQSLEKTTFDLTYKDNKYKCILNFPAIHLIDNILIAIKCGLMYDIEITDIVKLLKSFEMNENRLNIFKKENNVIIDDTYNASKESMIALFNIVKNEDVKNIFILADILETGKHTKKIHRSIKKELDKIENKEVITIGNNFKKLKYKNFNTIEEINNYLLNKKYENVIYAIKGSNAFNLKQVVNFLKNN